MTAAAFDTHAAVKKLQAAGFANLATQQDIADLKRDLKELEQRLVIKVGAMIAAAVGVVAVLVKLL